MGKGNEGTFRETAHCSRRWDRFGGARGADMLNRLSNEIAACHRHAEECAQKAENQRDPRLRQDFLDMEQHWLSLARRYEFVESLERFGLN